MISLTQQFDSNGNRLTQPIQLNLDPTEIEGVSSRMDRQSHTGTIEFRNGIASNVCIF